MRRRDLLRASAAAVGGGGATLGAVTLATDAADAQTALTLQIGGDSATLGADESVTALRLQVDVEWAYDVPDTASPSTVIVELAAATGEDALTTVASAESAELFTDAEGSESFDAGLLGDVVAASALAPDSGTRETDVTVEASLRVENSSGEVLARDSATDTATVSVERDTASADKYGDVGGSGEVVVETG